MSQSGVSGLGARTSSWPRNPWAGANDFAQALRMHPLEPEEKRPLLIRGKLQSSPRKQTSSFLPVPKCTSPSWRPITVQSAGPQHRYHVQRFDKVNAEDFSRPALPSRSDIRCLGCPHQRCQARLPQMRAASAQYGPNTKTRSDSTFPGFLPQRRRARRTRRGNETSRDARGTPLYLLFMAC